MCGQRDVLIPVISKTGSNLMLLIQSYCEKLQSFLMSITINGMQFTENMSVLYSDGLLVSFSGNDLIHTEALNVAFYDFALSD